MPPLGVDSDNRPPTAPQSCGILPGVPLKQKAVSMELPEESRRIAEQLADGYQNQLQEAASGFRQVFKEFSEPTRNADWKRLLEETPDAIEESFA